MEASTDAWRVKVPEAKDDVVTVFWCKCKDKENCPCKCKDKEKNICKCKEKSSKKKDKKRDPSMQSLATSLNENCCVCIGTFARYIKEVFKCVFCLACCRLPRTEFEQMLGEMLDATTGACHDIFCFIKKLLQVCVGSNPK